MEPRLHEVARHLGGFAAPSVARYEDNLVRANSVDDMGLILVNGEGSLVLSDLHQLLELERGVGWRAKGRWGSGEEG